MENRSARVWKRLLAFLLDLYLALAATIAFLKLLQQELPTDFSAVASGTFTLSPLGAMLVLYTSLFLLLYHVFCEYIVGQTPGMLVFGVRVERTKRKAGESGISFWQAVGRNVFILPLLPFSILWLVEPLYYLFQGERLLEHWTNTTTVE